MTLGHSLLYSIRTVLSMVLTRKIYLWFWKTDYKMTTNNFHLGKFENVRCPYFQENVTKKQPDIDVHGFHLVFSELGCYKTKLPQTKLNVNCIAFLLEFRNLYSPDQGIISHGHQKHVFKV